jgi:glycerophosphoryl diester phosphodiesterase
LGAQVPGLRLGFDPCDLPEARHLSTKAQLASFAAMTMSIAPEASIIYLEHSIILKAIAVGFDIVDAIHRRGPEVDAWTLKMEQPALPVAQFVAAGVDQITTSDPMALARTNRIRALNGPPDQPRRSAGRRAAA